MTSQASKIASIKTARKSGNKGMRAREALMDAGFALLSEMSPRELTAGTICIAAQMKRPSFYTYFDSVDALLDAMIRREIDRLEALYDAQGAADKSALHRVAGIPLNLVDIGQRDQARVKSVVALMGADPSFTHLRMDNLRRDIEDAMAEGSLSLVPAQIDLFMHIYVAGIVSLLARNAETGLSRAEVEGALGILLRGAGADAALLENIFND